MVIINDTVTFNKRNKKKIRKREKEKGKFSIIDLLTPWMWAEVAHRNATFLCSLDVDIPLFKLIVAH